MKRAKNSLLTVLAVAPLTVVACGDETKKPVTGTDATTGDSADTTTTQPPTDATTNPDTEIPVCPATRECGTFNGVNCGTCDPGETCNNAIGKCEAAGAPLGSFCGLTAACHPGPDGQGGTADDVGNFPDCVDNQCASRLCLSNNVFVLRDVCTKSCRIYQDDDDDSINDVDAPQDDCNPDDVVVGPAGNAFRCANMAAPGQNPVGYCVPGSSLKVCDADGDCGAGESCELTTIGGVSFRCLAKYRENDSWEGTTVGVSANCNEDPEAGERRYCETGICFGLGCVPACETNADCDTTKVAANTGCVAQKCAGTNNACTNDIDCSSWGCTEDIANFVNGAPSHDICWPKDCVTDNECGGGYYCRFFWNGLPGEESALENLCLRENSEGVGQGEACDPDPTDNIPGPVCANEDLCFGGFCSAMCTTDEQCLATQRCITEEVSADSDDNPDNGDDAVIIFPYCRTFAGDLGDQCRSNADCKTGEACQVYEAPNEDADGKADVPFLLYGVCEDVSEQFPATAGDFGATCSSGDECKSGFCLGATDTSPGYCTKVCASTAECGSVTIDGDEYKGICASPLLGYGNSLNDPTDSVYLPICFVTSDSLADCSSNLTCAAANEACLPNFVASDAAHPATLELLCQGLVDKDQTKPTGAVGSACDLTPDNGTPDDDTDDTPPECAGGFCLEDKDGKGYCSGVCKAGDACGGGTTCVETPFYPRVGKYEANTGSVGLCAKESECEGCFGNYNCAGDTVCANLGTAATPDFRCVPSCATNDDCTGEAATTCSDSADQRGEANKGCFAKNGAVPTNYCKQ